MSVERICIESLESLSSVKNINKWGCLYACYAIYCKLESLWLPFDDVNIVQFSSYWKWRGNIEHNMKFLEWEEDKPRADVHFWLEIGWKFYDVNWLIDSDRFIFHMIIPWTQAITFCKHALARREQWNESFDRVSGVVSMSEILKANVPYLWLSED